MEIKYLNTEASDRLDCENGDNIILEYAHGSIPNDLALVKTLSNPPSLLSVTAWSANLTTAEVENATSYPEFHVRGPGVLFAIENHTTKQGLYFNNMVLTSLDYIIIKIDPIYGISMKGILNVASYLAPASDIEISLAPRNNILSLTYESSFERVSGNTILDNILVNGLNSENTNNGSSFTVSQTDPGGGADQVLQFKDYNSNVLAQGYAEVGTDSFCYLNPSASSGVSGIIAPGGISAPAGTTWTATSASAVFKVGLANVVWKNRRWSIDETIEV